MKKKKDLSLKEVVESDLFGHAFGEVLARKLGGGVRHGLLDKNRILWQLENDKWVGKRSVWTKSFKSLWLEDVGDEEIKSWWCGKDADYSEVFTR